MRNVQEIFLELKQIRVLGLDKIRSKLILVSQEAELQLRLEMRELWRYVRPVACEIRKTRGLVICNDMRGTTPRNSVCILELARMAACKGFSTGASMELL